MSVIVCTEYDCFAHHKIRIMLLDIDWSFEVTSLPTKQDISCRDNQIAVPVVSQFQLTLSAATTFDKAYILFYVKLMFLDWSPGLVVM